MKHLYIALAAMFIAAQSADARPRVPQQKKQQKAIAASLARPAGMRPASHLVGDADERPTSMAWGYCESPYNAAAMGTGLVKEAIKLPVDVLKELAGNRITGVVVGTPPDAELLDEATYEFGNPIKECTVWLSYGLDEEPFMSAQGELSSVAFEWSEVKFASALPVSADKDIYVGVSYDVPTTGDVYGVVVDANYVDVDYSCYVYSQTSGFDANYEPVIGTDRQWISAGDMLGNVCVRVMLEGDNLPYNVVEAGDCYVPLGLKPDVKTELELLVQNLGANPINSLTLSMAMGDEAPVDIEIDQIFTGYDYDYNPVYGSLGFRERGLCYGEFSYPKEGADVAWKMSITAINGQQLDEPVAAGEGSFLSIENGFPKNNVFEEGTGTWCGACPVGIAGMEYMRENYSDAGFIGIAVHEGDRMDVLEPGHAYNAAIDFYTGAPIAFINRNMGREIYPSPEELEYEFADISELQALASIEGSLENANSDGRRVKLSLKSKFAFDGADSPYSYAYVVTEDNVGPYMQSNYLTGEPDDESYGFGSQPSEFSMMYNDVARNCSKPFGVEGSLPASIEAGEEYSADIEISLDDVKDLTKYHVVAMIVNNKNGAIENALMIDSPTYVGIEAIENGGAEPAISTADGKLSLHGVNAPVRVYRIDGSCAGVVSADGSMNMAAGMYIVVTEGQSARKVIVK